MKAMLLEDALYSWFPVFLFLPEAPFDSWKYDFLGYVAKETRWEEDEFVPLLSSVHMAPLTGGNDLTYNVCIE